MKKILVVMPLEEQHRKQLCESVGDRAELIFKDQTKEALTADDFHDVQALVGNAPVELVKASSIEFLQLNSSGKDPYALPGMIPDGCVLKNASAAYARSVSEYMLSVSFALVRKLELYRDGQRQHRWENRGQVTSIDGATVLVLGLGDIGGAYARKMKALGAYIIGVRASDKAKPDYVDEQYTTEQLQDVIGRADIVASIVPSTPETKGLFDRNMFARFKKGAYFINAGRGDAVDLTALQQAVESGVLSGAAIDVTDPEPLPSEHPIWDCERVLLTPHIAGGFFLPYTVDQIVNIACANLHAWLDQTE